VLAIRGDYVLQPDGWLEDGILLIDEGRIVDVGRDIDIPDSAEPMELHGKYLTPGLIDAHTHIGICETEAEEVRHDHDETTNPSTPEARAVDALHHKDNALRNACGGGVTAVGVSPGKINVIGGSGLVMKTYGMSPTDMVMCERAFMSFSLGEAPKQYYGSLHKMPSTRMGVAAVIRQGLVSAQEYQGRGHCRENGRSGCDLGLQALQETLQGGLPCYFHAQRADDILTAVRLMREFSLRGSIVLGAESRFVAKELAEDDISVVVGSALRSKLSQEDKNLSFETGGVLHKHGVKVALSTSAPRPPVHHLTVMASLAYMEGLSELDSLRAVTINPAEILGVDDRIGSLEPGKDADCVVFDSHPLSLTAKVESTFVNGTRVYALETDGGNLNLVI